MRKTKDQDPSLGSQGERRYPAVAQLTASNLSKLSVLDEAAMSTTWRRLEPNQERGGRLEVSRGEFRGSPGGLQATWLGLRPGLSALICTSLMLNDHLVSCVSPLTPQPSMEDCLVTQWAMVWCRIKQFRVTTERRRNGRHH